MKKSQFLFFSLPFLFFSFSADTPEVPPFADLLKKFNEEFPQEKVYLHTDKPYYLAGETIWFQAYVTAGSFHQLSPLSKTLYVELINVSNEFISRFIVRVENGLGRGQVPLPRYLATGSYQLRAYTNWMRNFPPEFFFTKEVKVWNADEPDAAPAPSSSDIDLQFFPEGGHLVAGIKSQVAFKAIASDGLHRNVSGQVFDAGGVRVAEFTSTHAGMGQFAFSPKHNESYVARIEQEEKTYPLPPVRETGFTIAFVPKFNAQEITIKLQTNPQTPHREAITVVAHNRGTPAFIAQANLTNNLYFVKIPKARLEHGLAHITIFDALGRPQANRLIFTFQASPLNIEIKTDHPETETRKPTVVEIHTRNADNQPVRAFVSLAATNNQEVLFDNTELTIENYLLLQSDVRGHIENPGYYFDTANHNRLEKLDVLLMTQGWIRFDWEKIVANQWPMIRHGIEQGITLQGTLRDDLSKKGVEGGKVMYVPIEGASDVAVAPTGREGRFVFDALTFYDSASVVLQGRNKKNKPFVLLETDPIYPNQDAAFKPRLFFTKLSEFERFIVQKGLERNKINAAYGFGDDVMILDEVEIKDRIIDERKENRIYQGATKSIRASEVPGAINLFHPLELLRGVAGVHLRPNPPGYDVIIRGVGTIGGSTTPLVLLDNVPVNISTLNQLPVESIESVDLFTGAQATVFGSQGGNGVIAFFSKKGFSSPAKAKGIFSTRIGGYQVPAEFYVPRYDAARPEHVKPDRRTTVFWSPAVETDENGIARIEYYNGDEAISVRLQAEGITREGLIGAGTAIYRVKKGK